MGDEMPAERDVYPDIARALVRGGAVIEQSIDGDGLVGDLARNARVGHVDDSADGRRAEHQGGWTAKHFDPLRRERVDGNGIVGVRRGRGETADAVDQDADSLA